MVSTSNKPNIQAKDVSKETLLTPRFYTTDFKEMSELDISSNEAEIKAIVEEFRVDYNRDHFIRDKEFSNTWENFDDATRNIFIEFLERSCTAEFSGFLLYKEISRNLRKSNPLLAEGFSFMSRDEARHAGFLNKAMSDFNISLDLGFLTKTRKYTFFAPKFIFYATYLSEKIGYWRYITIFRHLEKNPEYRVYPLFRFFESWCQDENRHGDFFAALLKFSIVLEILFTPAPMSPLTESTFSIAASIVEMASRDSEEVSNETRPASSCRSLEFTASKVTLICSSVDEPNCRFISSPESGARPLNDVLSAIRLISAVN